MCACVENKIRQEVNELMQPYKQEKDNLIQILNEIQEKYGYIPKVAQEEVSKYLKVPMAEIYGVITSEIKEKDVLEKELTKTIRTVDDILNNETITNAMLKTIIDVIEVDSDGNVEVRLKLLNEIGTAPTVITNFEDIKGQNDTVTKSNNSTQRRK